MTKRKLLLDMMIRALAEAEKNYEVFTTEYTYEDRKPYSNTIKFAWHYWVEEKLFDELAEKLGIAHMFEDKYDSYELFLTYITFGDAFGLSSPKATEMLLSGEAVSYTHLTLPTTPYV